MPEAVVDSTWSGEGSAFGAGTRPGASEKAAVCQARGRGYRLVWRIPLEGPNGRMTLLACSRSVRRPEDMLSLMAGDAGDPWDGEYRVDLAGGGSVYTSAPAIRAWLDAGGLLPESDRLSEWGGGAERRQAITALVVRLRDALAPAIRRGLLTERLASSIVHTVERAVIGGEPLGSD